MDERQTQDRLLSKPVIIDQLARQHAPLMLILHRARTLQDSPVSRHFDESRCMYTLVGTKRLGFVSRYEKLCARSYYIAVIAIQRYQVLSLYVFSPKMIYFHQNFLFCC